MVNDCAGHLGNGVPGTRLVIFRTTPIQPAYKFDNPCHNQYSPCMTIFTLPVGDYRLSYRHDSVLGFHWWLQHEDGEGMSISLAKFNEMIDRYFQENF